MNPKIFELIYATKIDIHLYFAFELDLYLLVKTMFDIKYKDFNK